jgi:Domain of unknown function (DUF4411)
MFNALLYQDDLGLAYQMFLHTIIFSAPQFQNLVTQKNILAGRPVADPFLIASAKIKSGCVVTEEEIKEHAAKTPNVCEHFNVQFTNLEGFMKLEGWSF